MLRRTTGLCSDSIRLMILTIALMLLVAGSCSDDDASVTIPVATSAPAATDAVATTGPEWSTTAITAPLEPIAGVFTAALVASLPPTNYWAYLDVDSNANYGYVLGHQTTSLYTISVPDFLHIPVLAAEAAPDPVREGDGWTATVPLRAGMTWSDGEPVTAHDFVFSVNTNADLELGSNWISNHPFKSTDDPTTEDVDETQRWVDTVEAIDPYTVKITFAPSEEPPGRPVYHNGILFHPILPEHFWGPVVEACRTEEDPKECLYAADGAGQPSAGPLILESWDSEAGATLVANPDYYYRGVTYTVYENLTFTQTGGAHALDEAFYGDPEGKVRSQYTDGPFVSEVRLLEYDGAGGAFDAFIRGDVDFVLVPWGIPGDYEERILGLDGIESEVNPSEGFMYVAFNLRKAPTNDPAFRRAIACLFDKETIADRVPEGTAIPIYSLVPPQNDIWFNDDVETWGRGMSPGERLEAAAGVLTDAGYTWEVPPEPLRDPEGDYSGEYVGGEGLRGPDGVPVRSIEFMVMGPTPNPLLHELGSSMEEWGERLGITIELAPVDLGFLVGSVFPPQDDGLGWDMYALEWRGGDPSLPCTSHQAFFGADQDTVTGGGFNTPGYDDAVFEALSGAFDRALDLDEARTICRAMERNISENLPYIVTWSVPMLEAWPAHVHFPITRQLLGGINGFPGGWLGAVRVDE